jgi:hypothetical protein
MLQCFRCRAEVPNEAVKHRVVNTFSSAGGRGFANYYRKVALCPRCAALHDSWQRFRIAARWTAVAIVLIGALYLAARYFLL